MIVPWIMFKAPLYIYIYRFRESFSHSRNLFGQVMPGVCIPLYDQTVFHADPFCLGSSAGQAERLWITGEVAAGGETIGSCFLFFVLGRYECAFFWCPPKKATNGFLDSG